MGVVRGEMREQSQNSPGCCAIQCRSAVQVLVNPIFLVHKWLVGVSSLVSTIAFVFLPELFHVEQRWENLRFEFPAAIDVPRGTSSPSSNNNDTLVGHWNWEDIPFEFRKQRRSLLSLLGADQKN